MDGERSACTFHAVKMKERSDVCCRGNGYICPAAKSIPLCHFASPFSQKRDLSGKPLDPCPPSPSKPGKTAWLGAFGLSCDAQPLQGQRPLPHRRRHKRHLPHPDVPFWQIWIIGLCAFCTMLTFAPCARFDPFCREHLCLARQRFACCTAFVAHAESPAQAGFGAPHGLCPARPAALRR